MSSESISKIAADLRRTAAVIKIKREALAAAARAMEQGVAKDDLPIIRIMMTARKRK